MSDLDIDTSERTEAGDQPTGRVAGVGLSALWFASLALAGVFALTDVPLGYSVCVLYAGLVGLGSAAISFVPDLTTTWRLTLSFATSVSSLILVSLGQAEARWWHPVPVAIGLAGAASLVHLRVLVRSRTGWSHIRAAVRVAFTTESRLHPALVLLVLVAVGTCAITAYSDSSNDIGYGGLLRSLNPLWFLGTGVLVVLAALSAMSRRPSLPPAAMVTVVGLVLTLTPAIVYGAPRSQSAQKHIGLVELVQQGHGLTSSYTIYNDWGGFFTWVAWLAGVARIGNLLTLATFWPALMMLLMVPALYCLASSLLPLERLRWGAVLIAVLADSIGADYFSPQSIGFVLAVVVFAVATSTLPWRLTLGLVVLLAAALAPTHQLSPYLLCGALFWLLIFRVVKSWWLLAGAAVPTLAWTLLHYGALGNYISFASIGSASNFTLPSQRAGVQQQFIVKEAILATAAAVLVLVLGGAYVVLRHRTKANWGLAIASGVGLGVVAVNAYGNEGIFRAVLFAIPWLAILFMRAVADVPHRARGTGLAIVSVLLAGLYLVGAFSLDGGTVTRKTDLAVLDRIVTYARDHPHRLVVAVSMNAGDLPIAGPTSPDNLYYGPLKPILSSAAHPSEDAVNRGVTRTTRQLRNQPEGSKPTTDIFLIYSPAAAIHDQQYGFASPDAQRLIVQEVNISPMWHRWTHSGDSQVWKLVPLTAVH